MRQYPVFCLLSGIGKRGETMTYLLCVGQMEKFRREIIGKNGYTKNRKQNRKKAKQKGSVTDDTGCSRFKRAEEIVA